MQRNLSSLFVILLAAVSGWSLSMASAEESPLSNLLDKPKTVSAPVAEAEVTPELKATLLTEHASLSPSGKTTLALKIDIPDTWHIYHPIVLDTGLPTEVAFTLTKGIKIASGVRYPVPVFAATETGGDTIDYLGYEEEAVLLVELAGDESLIPGSKAKISTFITALICEHNGTCIPVDTTAELEIPITSKLGAPQYADLFKSARKALPAPLSEAAYMKGSKLSTTHSQLPIGADSELILTLNIGKNYHIQDRDPGVEGLIPTRIWIETADGIEFDFDAQKWPKPKIEKIEYIGDVRQQGGKTEIRTPFKITDPLFTPGEVKLHVLVEYQTCTETGQCYPPTQTIGSVTFEVVPADQPAKAGNNTLSKPGWIPAVEHLAVSDSDSQSETSDSAVTSADAPPAAESGLWVILLTFGGAFLGGIILNIMPCVLPVVSLKIFGFVNQAGEDHSRVFKMGLVYAAGVLISFLPLAIIIPAIGASWGGVIMQNPVVVILISGFVFTFGLSMVGLYEIHLPGSVAAAGSVQREGYGGAFTSGLLTTILATPCTGPFLGSAVGTLATLPAAVSFIGIMLIGAGLAFPYVLLSAFPGWLKFLPKPGNWMITFKSITGWILLAVPLWLLWNLTGFGDADLLFGAVVFLFAVALASTFFGQIELNTSAAKTMGVMALATATVAVGWMVGPVYYGQIFAEPEEAAPTINFTSGTTSPQEQDAQQPLNFDVSALYPEGAGPKLAWQEWEPGLPERLAEAGYTVYIDFTATWCLTCQTNKVTVLHTDEIYEQFREMKVIPLIADFTRRNADIQAELRKFNRNGVPLNLIFPAGNPEAVITMPELLTQAIVSDRLKQAGPTTAVQPERDIVASR